jgi:hypothetical protein
MERVVPAALAYFVAVFAVGFVLGVVREGIVRPRFGTLGAIAMEAPAMLLACWWAARWLVGRFGVAARGARWRMGALAFGLLMVAELGGSLVLRGMAPGAWLAHFATAPGALSLALFLAFAVMPVLVRK